MSYYTSSISERNKHLESETDMIIYERIYCISSAKLNFKTMLYDITKRLSYGFK